MTPGISLPKFNATDVWFAPGAPINSTEAFTHASKLERTAYIANRYLFVSIMVVLIGFVALSLPGSVTRMRGCPRWWWGAYLRRITASKTEVTGRAVRLRRPLVIWNPFPVRTVPFLRLTWFETALVALLWVITLGLAAWCQSAFLTHASRATLIIMGLVALSAALGVKSGGIGTWTSCGYAAINYLHRWTGRLVLLLSTLHVIAYLVVFYKAGIASYEMRKPENYLAAIAYGGLCLAGIGSIRPIRQSAWLVFKYSHHIGVLLLLAGLNYHAPDIVPYLIAVWILLALNTVFRSWTTRLVHLECTAIADGSSTLVRTDSPFDGFIPGQHVRLRCISGLGAPWTALESHPFTIASANGQPLQLVIKSAGDWTSRLHRAAIKGSKLTCTLEGPYGGPINFMFSAFESVCLIVGGSGISFGLGVANGVLRDAAQNRSQTKRLCLVWTVKDVADLVDIAPLLMELRASSRALQLTIKVFCTSPRKPVLEATSPDLEQKPTTLEEEKLPGPSSKSRDPAELSRACTSLDKGRPDLKVLLAEIVAATGDGGLGVGLCGPAGMVEQAERLCRGYDKSALARVGGIQVHAERFSL